MVILCSRMGLRVSDVANLSFENIDWENNIVSLVQYKTGNPLSLPLLPIVGNAIIDYLRYARPKLEESVPKLQAAIWRTHPGGCSCNQ